MLAAVNAVVDGEQFEHRRLLVGDLFGQQPAAGLRVLQGGGDSGLGLQVIQAQ